MNSCIFNENSIYSPSLHKNMSISSSLSLSHSLKILLAIKSECIDFDKKRVTKNVTLKTNKQRMLFVKKYRIFKFQACQGLLIILQKFI